MQVDIKRRFYQNVNVRGSSSHSHNLLQIQEGANSKGTHTQPDVQCCLLGRDDL